MSSSTCHIEELSSEALGRTNTERAQADAATCYEAELNAEVERLKMGDRSSSSRDEAAHAAAHSHASAAASSAPDANAEARAADAADNSHSASTADSAAADGELDAHSAVDASAPILIEEVVEKDAAKAVAAKGRGNQFYARQQYAEAIDEYTLAINLCPSGEAAEAADRENLAVFYSNRAAAYLMQQRHEETISDCTQSLLLHPSNPKALSRRAKAHEALDQLAEAVDDLKVLVALDERDRDSAKALARVEKALAEKNEKMKTEMLGKLKDFGNTLLGKFGMSLDNFKATQDPSTGSYNISFGK